VPDIISISGRIGAGKDVIAGHLVEKYGYVRRGWADALKLEVAARLPRTLEAYVRYGYPGRLHTEPVGAIIHDLLWAHRDHVTRALLQEWGTELRRADDPDYWVKAWARDLPPKVVVPDTRFQNEADTVQRLGGRLWRVVRPGYEATGDHASETTLDGFPAWDALLVNDGTVGDLRAQVDALMANRRET
jgi:hypothetical protein